MESKHIEETAYGTREYISPELLLTVKVGETWSLDYTTRCFKYNPADHLVAFDGFHFDGEHLDRCWRWKHEATGRVFTYTEQQCCRLIYKLVKRP